MHGRRAQYNAAQMARGACSTFDPATVLRRAITCIAAVYCGSTLFDMTVVSIVVRRPTITMCMHCNHAGLQGCKSFRSMARAKRRNSHGLHAQRYAQKQHQKAAKLTEGFHNNYIKVYLRLI